MPMRWMSLLSAMYSDLLVTAHNWDHTTFLVRGKVMVKLSLEPFNHCCMLIVVVLAATSACVAWQRSPS